MTRTRSSPCARSPTRRSACRICGRRWSAACKSMSSSTRPRKPKSSKSTRACSGSARRAALTPTSSASEARGFEDAEIGDEAETRGGAGDRPGFRRRRGCDRRGVGGRRARRVDEEEAADVLGDVDGDRSVVDEEEADLPSDLPDTDLPGDEDEDLERERHRFSPCGASDETWRRCGRGAAGPAASGRCARLPS